MRGVVEFERTRATGRRYNDGEMIPNGPNPAPREMRDPPITIANLREVGLFGALSDEVLDHLVHTLKTLRVGTGQTVFREGDRSAHEMYIVLEGEIEVLKRSRNRPEMRIAMLGPSDCFGEMSMIDMQPRSATVRTLAPSRLLRIDSEDMDGLYRYDLKSYTLVILNIARHLSRRLRVADGILAYSASNSGDEPVLPTEL
jgi:CRP/FNR family transcriptional regulator, cyclic AMP receptor protein